MDEQTAVGAGPRRLARRRPRPRRSRPAADGGRRGLVVPQSTPVPGERGFDGTKKVDGTKRHILVDTAGRLLAAHVTAANVQDRAASADLHALNPCPPVAHVWADKGYTGQAPADAATAAGIELKIVSGPKPVGGFVVQPRHRVVERTNRWINRHRRLVQQHEATLTAHEAFVILSQIRLLLRRLDRHG